MAFSVVEDDFKEPLHLREVGAERRNRIAARKERGSVAVLDALEIAVRGAQVG
jgi:hypothetical protein